MAKQQQKTALAREMEARVEERRQQFRQAHTDLFDETTGETASVPEPTDLTALNQPPGEDASHAPAAAEAPEPVATPEVVAEPPVSEPPAAEPAAEPAAPPVTGATAPQQPSGETPTAQTPRTGPEWAAFRRIERENRRMKKQLEALASGAPTPTPETPPVAAPAQAPVAQPQAPVDDTDPLGIRQIVSAETGPLREQLAREAQMREAQQVRMEIEQQENQFRATHPDYDSTVGAMIQVERRRYATSGRAAVDAATLLNNDQMRQQIEQLADNVVLLAEPNGGMRFVARNQVPPQLAANCRDISDQEAAEAIATEMWIEARRQDVVSGARAQRRPVPEVAYELAGVMGVRGQGGAPAAALAVRNGNGTVAPAPSGQTVAERIRQSARATAAGRSIASASGGAPPIGQPARHTLSSLMALRARDPEAYNNYIAEQKAIDPQWHRKLTP
jgi:hypothetical protein